MTIENIRIKFLDFQRALQRLDEALKKDIASDDLYLDGIIQRFEFCFELAWKTIQAFLAYDGLPGNSPRSCIREGAKVGLIADAEGWLDMLEKRNLSTTYNEETARLIYHGLTEKYHALLRQLCKSCENVLKSLQENCNVQVFFLLKQMSLGF